MSGKNFPDNFGRRPIGWLYYSASALLVVGLPIAFFVQEATFSAGIGMAIVGLVIASVLVVVLRLVTWMYLKVAMLIAGINVLLAIHAISRSGDDRMHVAVWCELAQLLDVHQLWVEWLCALAMVVGWMSLTPKRPHKDKDDG